MQPPGDVTLNKKGENGVRQALRVLFHRSDDVIILLRQTRGW